MSEDSTRIEEKRIGEETIEGLNSNSVLIPARRLGSPSSFSMRVGRTPTRSRSATSRLARAAGALTPPHHVRQPLRHRLDLLEPVEQQAGRVPRAVEKRFAGGRRQRHREAAGPEASRSSARGRSAARWRDPLRRRPSAPRAWTRRRSRTACRARRSCRRRSPKRTDRPPRETPGGGSPAARARATSRSRSWR